MIGYNFNSNLVTLNEYFSKYFHPQTIYWKKKTTSNKGMRINYHQKQIPLRSDELHDLHLFELNM